MNLDKILNVDEAIENYIRSIWNEMTRNYIHPIWNSIGDWELYSARSGILKAIKNYFWLDLEISTIDKNSY